MRWIRIAVRYGDYTPSVHFEQRLRERDVSMQDALHALMRCSNIREYPQRMPDHGGTCWRVFGHDVDGEMELIIGVEAYRDADGRQVILCTVLPPTEKAS